MEYTHIIELCERMSIIYGGIWAKNTKCCWMVCAICQYPGKADGEREETVRPACPFCAGMLYFSDKGQCAVRRFFRDKEKSLCESD